MTSLKAREKTGRELQLEAAGFTPELIQRATGRLSDALEATTRDKRPDHSIRLRAADSVLDRMLPRETHGNAKSSGQAVVVVVQPWVGELAPKTLKRLKAESRNEHTETTTPGQTPTRVDDTNSEA